MAFNKMIYKLNSSINLKEIGKYPQTTSGGKPGNLFEGHEGNYGPLEIENPISPLGVFHKKAKKTDYIGIVSNNIKLTISPKFYHFLEPFLSEHQSWDMQFSNDVYMMDWKKMDYVVKEGADQVFYDYKIVHISYPNENIIDYKQSEFILDTRENYLESFDLNGVTKQYLNNPDHKLIKIESRDHYRSLNMDFKKQGEHRKVIIAKKVYLNLSTNSDNIFRVITPIPNLSGYYFSNKLKEEILKEGFTGMELKSLEELNFNFEFCFQ